MSGSFVVTWRDPQNGEITTLRAGAIADSSLGLTFVAISDLKFDTDSPIVNPANEALRRRFENTKVLHLSIHSIVSIEEVDSKALVFEKDRSNLLLFPK